ncbi:hypothetical protein [Acinetobacter sp. B51(2017)]|uniref:hypothetical protein n=1 Tax=Acinetobacter sp. B51(2017) TaxID=2060938 RepID=UPI000F0926F0|nr:hypothetical protein [Acinetobacter sp. B51(2017)]
MSDFSNITVTSLDDGMVSLLIDDQPISEKYGMKFEASIVDELQALENGQNMKLFDQFIFSHTDLNFEHIYKYITHIVKQDDAYKVAKNFTYIIKIDGQPEIEHVITKQGQPMTAADVSEFINSHIQKSLTEYTDLNYAY